MSAPSQVARLASANLDGPKIGHQIRSTDDLLCGDGSVGLQNPAGEADSINFGTTPFGRWSEPRSMD
jgi:hypothetical protein